jgi:hypothetical protein
MRFYTSQLLAGVLATISVVNAHVKVVYPALRGPNVSKDQILFCGGYNNTGTRVPFPLNNGFILFTTGHPHWTVGVQISTVANPDSFDDFHIANGSDQLVVPYYQSQGTQGCIPVNIGALGLPGVGNGSNVTLQLVQDGTDGNLYQCMDLTLSSSFTTPSDVQCVNITAIPSSTSSGAPTPTSSSTGQTSGGVLGSMQISGLLGLSALGFLLSNLV